jgi:hypothetical protein
MTDRDERRRKASELIGGGPLTHEEIESDYVLRGLPHDRENAAQALPAPFCGPSAPAGHAVRWARRQVRGEMDYTRWHWTIDACFTLCRRPVLIGLDGTYLPETDERKEQVTCRICLRALEGRHD